VLAKFFFPQVILIWHDHQGLREKITINHRPLLKILSRKIDGIIVVNDMLKKWDAKHTKVPEDRIRFINNFPDPRITSFHKKKSDEITILCLANLRPEKNHLMLVRAFNKVKNRLAGVKLNLRLAGNVTDLVTVTAVTSLIHELGLQDDIEVLGTIENTTELLVNADIAVLSSSAEGLPVSLLEYGMAGLPVLVTDVGQCKEVVQDGKCGWVVPSRDLEAYTNALFYIIRHPADAAEKGRRLKERISTAYGPKHFVFEYVTFSANLI
jgi:glycosyltransferase involved in cell wall biosynthesis